MPGPDGAGLKGKVAVVTGGGGALGRAIAEAIAGAGARTILADLDGVAAHTVAAELLAAGLEADHIAMDVAQEGSVQAAFDAVRRRHGRLDILVNNAGIAARRPSVELALEDWNRVIAVNLTGTFLCSREAARQMIAAGAGAVVNIASIMGLVGNSLYANPAYHASKGGIVNLTRAHAAEWAPFGIRVNAVAPTFVDTALTARLLNEPGLRKGIETRTPMGRLAKGREVADAVAFLASDAAAFITGAIIPVDGVWTAV